MNLQRTFPSGLTAWLGLPAAAVHQGVSAASLVRRQEYRGNAGVLAYVADAFAPASLIADVPDSTSSTASFGPLAVPPGFTKVRAASSGLFTGGYGTAPNGATRPLCWDAGGSPVDLLPADALGGVIVAAAPGEAELGGSILTAWTHGQYHAAVWSDPPSASAIDLHPARPGYAGSSVYAVQRVAGRMQQAGVAVINTIVCERPVMRWHAMVWCGTADSAVDLHGLLPDHFVQSTATAIAADGHITGAAQDSDGMWHAVGWTMRPVHCLPACAP